MSALRDLQLRGGRVVVPAGLLDVRFARSGGPGGQNVNKVETKVDLRLDLTALVDHLGEAATGRLRAAFRARIDADDRLQVVCDEHRSRHRNIEAALERLEAMLEAALQVPRQRRKTKPTRGSVERRIEGKRQRSDVKRKRRKPGDEG